MLPDPDLSLLEAALAMPPQPLPEEWEPLQDLMTWVDVDLRPVCWGDWEMEQLRLIATHAEGSPYASFGWQGHLIISSEVSLQAVAHELGHVGAWRIRDSFETNQYNWSLNECVNAGMEYDACCIEIVLLVDWLEQYGEEHWIREHYSIAVLISYDPDDTSSDTNDPDYDPREHYVGEAGWAWSEWNDALEHGRNLLKRLEEAHACRPTST